MTEAKTASATNDLREPPEGWKRIEGVGEPANIFELDTSRPDFPEKWRHRAETRDRERLARDPHVRAEIARLRSEFADFDFQRALGLIEFAHASRARSGDPAVFHEGDIVLDRLQSAIRNAVDRSRPKDVELSLTLRYFCEQLLPFELAWRVNDLLPLRPSPIEITTNAENLENGRTFLVVILPGDTVLRFRGIVRRDINRIGRFITEAIAIQSPDRDSRGNGGRRGIEESADDQEKADLVARLFHWEGWSQRRIAAFLGWMKPTDDWNDPKTRARIEQRVRRWLRVGESRLAMSFDDIDDPENEDDDQPWKRRPKIVEAAVQAEDRKRGRR